MLPILAAIFLWPGDPGELVRRLSDDSIEIREKAAGELYRRGEEIRGFLIDAHEAVAELETRARLKEILRRLDADERIRSFGGGHRVAGFGASLRSDRFFGSGPFRLTVDVMNLGTVDRDLPGIVAWEQELPDQEVRATGAQARVQLKKFISSGGLRRTTWRNGESAAPSVRLRPGDCARFEVTLEVQAVPAGDYDVTVEYFARDLVPGAEENLKTNSVRLMIRR